MTHLIESDVLSQPEPLAPGELQTRYQKHLGAREKIVDQLEIAGRDLLIRVLDLTLIERELGEEGAAVWDEEAAHQVVHLRNEFRSLARRIQQVITAPPESAGAVKQAPPLPDPALVQKQQPERTEREEATPRDTPRAVESVESVEAVEAVEAVEKKGLFSSLWSGRAR